MNPTFLTALAVCAGVLGGALILVEDRRLSLGLLAGTYLTAALLAALTQPVLLAAARLGAGLMAVAILWVTLNSLGWAQPRARGPGALPSGLAFRAITVLLVLIAAVGLSLRPAGALQSVPVERALGAMLLIAMGLLHLGISEEPFRIGAGLLTALAGFELAYSALEPSLAVGALLASVHLGLALVVSYVLAAVEGPVPEERAR